jgi:hypothetical protein
MTEETQFEPGTYKESMHVNWDQLLTRNNRAVNLKTQQITTTTTATNATLVTTGSHNLSTTSTQNKCINQGNAEDDQGIFYMAISARDVMQDTTHVTLKTGTR